MSDIVFNSGAEEEVLDDEFDMTEIAANLGVYHEAPKQEQQHLSAKEKNAILQEVIKEMDAEDKSNMTDEEVEAEMLKRLSDRIKTAEAELQKKAKKQEAEKEKKSKSRDAKYFPCERAELEAIRVSKLQGGDLHVLNIDKSTSRGKVLEVIRTMALEVEQILRGKKPFDWGEVPHFLTIKRWNDTIAELCEDEYWSVDLKDPYDLEDTVAGEVDEDLRELINETVRMFSFYRRQSNFQEKDGVWTETNGAKFVKLHTRAVAMIKKLRAILPNNRDKLCGFELLKPFGKKSLNAYKKRREIATESEKKQFDKFVNEAIDKLNKQGCTPENVKKFLMNGTLLDVMKNSVTLQVDEGDIHIIMLYFMIMNEVSIKATGKNIPELAKVKTSKEVDDEFDSKRLKGV